ncbi:MAG: cell wall-binding repeat-containing protein [Propionibacteriaceae bacterium]|nr:cell wall-binding repeat-containing protein [Propionibacteriaceae bacterium]
MSKNLRRSAVAAVGAAALALPLALPANAAVIDPDLPITIQPVAGASVYRIADRDRIGTAIEAAQSRDDWGRGASQWVWECDGNNVVPRDGQPVNNTNRWNLGDEIQVGLPNNPDNQVTCTVVSAPAGLQFMDIIVARSDDYSDALAGTPLADVLDAPVLINPTDKLDSRNAAEIARLAGLRGTNTLVTVHLLGGTNALSHNVENQVDAVTGVDRTFRYQGIDRYETAVNLGYVTVEAYGIESGADIMNVNTYVTTGINFPDALAAGAAAAENDGIVLLTKGEEMDGRGYTDDFIAGLNDWVNDDDWSWLNWMDINTNENFGVGGPAVRALRAADVRTAANYDGRDRYETATLTAEGTFDNPTNFAVASGLNYPDAVVASAYIANSDGPLLLSHPTNLTPVTAAYLSDNVDNGDKVVTFGGTGTLSNTVTQQIAELFNY